MKNKSTRRNCDRDPKKRVQYNNNRYIKKWSLTKRAMDFLGGKCNHCDENHIAALSFHHLDPKEKEFNVCKLMSKTWEELEGELKKCILLCENCHRKYHFNQKRFDENYEEICKRASGEKIRKISVCKRWSLEENNLLIKLCNQGLNSTEISNELKREPSFILRKAKENNLTLTKRRCQKIELTDCLKQKVFELNDKFYTVNQISIETKISYRVVRKILKGDYDGK